METSFTIAALCTGVIYLLYVGYMLGEIGERTRRTENYVDTVYFQMQYIRDIVKDAHKSGKKSVGKRGRKPRKAE